MKKKVTKKPRKSKSKPFPIVAIGASAGGVEATTELIKNLPLNTGMAFVHIQHLDPTHKSYLEDILGRVTKMKVQTARNLMVVEPNNIYIIPHNKDITLLDGVLTLNNRAPKPAVNMPIDKFFRSLAEVHKERAIGVILSGNANDGTLGLKAIKDNGGLTFAQNSSAKFESMPKSAIAEGAVDIILSPKAIAIELGRISKNTKVIDQVLLNAEDEVSETLSEDLTQIINFLRKSVGVDFQHYKPNTIKRRIVRRMLLYKLPSLVDYLDYLKKNPNEAHVLFQDLLINVTSFFRDPDTLEYLKKTIVPKLVKGKTSNDSIRIWVPACSTGEEAYSVAIILNEILIDKGMTVPIQIFASDLSEHAITKARVGLYSKNDLAGVSPKRLQRFFTRIDGSYRINKIIRDSCVFAPHNILSDPPFSRLDLISCCNLMIYLDPILQRKTLATFHYSLKSDGYLVLGKSESLGTSGSLFSQVEKKYKVFIKKNEVSNKVKFDINYRQPEVDKNGVKVKSVVQTKQQPRETNFEKAIEQILLSKFVAASVVVNKELDIFQFHGPVSTFLEISPGKASLNLLKLIRPGLVFDLRNTIHKATKSNKPEKKLGLEITNNGALINISIEVVPLGKENNERVFLVVFEKLPYITSEESRKSSSSKDQMVKKLQQELEATKEDIRSILEEQEASNEELQSANEEIVSSNEELQSINEELETSKEEVESSNEELMTINNELQVRNEQLAESHEYSEAVSETIREAVLILDKDFRVRSANKAFYRIFKTREEETEGMLIYELGNRQWDILELRQLLEDILSKRTTISGYEVQHDFLQIGKKTMLLHARTITQKVVQKQLIILAIEDITEHRMAEQVAKERELWFKNMANDLDIRVKERTKELDLMNHELQRSNSELQQFAYVASHDLQEPLRKILTYIDRINHKNETLTAFTTDFLERINEAAKRMANLIDDILDLSTISVAEKKFSKVDLNKVLKDVVRDLELSIAEKKGKITYGRLPVIEGEPRQMSQLFYNIIGNSLKFSEDGKSSRIILTSKTLSDREVSHYKMLDNSKSFVEIVVVDNGIGFKQEFADQIFVIFQRLNDKKKYPGTGIGLALCRKIVNTHGGHIFAKSGKDGAEFHIILPTKQLR